MRRKGGDDRVGGLVFAFGYTCTYIQGTWPVEGLALGSSGPAVFRVHVKDHHLKIKQHVCYEREIIRFQI